MTQDEDFWQWIGADAQARGAPDTGAPETEAEHPAALSVARIGAPAPLDAQFGLHPPLPAPEPFLDTLFGPLPEAAGAAPPALYALLDGARIAGLPERLEASGLPHASLMSGQSDDDLAEVAPYLVQLDRDAALTRRLFTGQQGVGGLWTAQAGIFLRSEQGLEALRAHLRHFTRVQDRAGAWFYFRFWDPQIAQGFLTGLATRPDAVRRWFGMRGTRMIEALIVPQGGEEHIALEVFRPVRAVIDAEPDRVFRLEPGDRAMMGQARLEADVTAIIMQVMRDFPDLLDGPQRDGFPQQARRSLSTFMECGIRQKPNLLMLLVWELAFGPERLRADPVLAKILSDTAGETERMNAMAERLAQLG